MATRRKSTRSKAGRRAPARRKRTPAKRAAARGRARGARQARRTEASREVHARGRGVAEERPPVLRLAEPTHLEETAGRTAADREAAELARRIEETVGTAGESLRLGPESAPDRLRVHREDVEEAARWREPSGELPGAAALGLELAVGALRLAGSLATAPLRIGLALLRR